MLPTQTMEDIITPAFGGLSAGPGQGYDALFDKVLGEYPCAACGAVTAQSVTAQSVTAQPAVEQTGAEQATLTIEYIDSREALGRSLDADVAASSIFFHDKGEAICAEAGFAREIGIARHTAIIRVSARLQHARRYPAEGYALSEDARGLLERGPEFLDTFFDRYGTHFKHCDLIGGRFDLFLHHRFGAEDQKARAVADIKAGLGEGAVDAAALAAFADLAQGPLAQWRLHPVTDGAWRGPVPWDVAGLGAQAGDLADHVARGWAGDIAEARPVMSQIFRPIIDLYAGDDLGTWRKMMDRKYRVVARTLGQFYGYADHMATAAATAQGCIDDIDALGLADAQAGDRGALGQLRDTARGNIDRLVRFWSEYRRDLEIPPLEGAAAETRLFDLDLAMLERVAGDLAARRRPARV